MEISISPPPAASLALWETFESVWQKFFFSGVNTFAARDSLRRRRYERPAYPLRCQCVSIWAGDSAARNRPPIRPNLSSARIVIELNLGRID